MNDLKIAREAFAWLDKQYADFGKNLGMEIPKDCSMVIEHFHADKKITH